MLFTKRTLIRRGEYEEKKYNYAAYSNDGSLYGIYDSIEDIKIDGLSKVGIKNSIKNGIKYKNFRFIRYDEFETVKEKIDNLKIATVDNIEFFNVKDISEYVGVSRQYVSYAEENRVKTIRGKNIQWS